MPIQHTNESLSLSTTAMNHLGIAKQPFDSLIFADDVIFSDAIIDQLLDTTKHHLQFSELLLIIEGDFGSGKTTLLRKILQNKIPNIYFLPIVAETTNTLAQIQQNILTRLKEQGETKSLDENLKNINNFDQIPVLIIDDAHVLSDTTLQEILQYQKQLKIEKQTPLKILLLANKGMSNTLEKISDIQHNQLYVQEMPEYTPKQIQAFVQHKINLANYTGEPILNNDDITSIFKKSNGSPLSIMELTVAHIEKQAQKKTSTFSLKFSPGILITVSLILISVTVFTNFYLKLDTLKKPENKIIKSPAELQQIEELSPISTTDPLSENTGFNDRHESSALSKNMTANELETPAVITGLKEASKSISVKINNTVEEPAANHQADKAITDVSPPEPRAAKDVEIEETKTTNTTILKQTETTNAILTELSAPVEITPVAAVVDDILNANLQQLNQLGLHDKTWIMAQDINHWSLQITGARDPATLVYMAKRYNLSSNSAWYQTQLKGSPWYVLIYGLYVDKDASNQAKQFLPGDLKSKKPFSRSFNSIRASAQ